MSSMINDAVVSQQYITVLSLSNNLCEKINSVLKLTRVCGFSYIQIYLIYLSVFLLFSRIKINVFEMA